jgi:hypothetical protein
VANKKLEALASELQALEMWDRMSNEGLLRGEVEKVSYDARRMRRCEIIREIDFLIPKGTREPRAGV